MGKPKGRGRRMFRPMRLTPIQEQLRDLMSEVSELHYCARWMDGTEYRLWQFLVEPTDSGEWGFYSLDPALRGELGRLSGKASGWIVFAEGEGMKRQSWQ